MSKARIPASLGGIEFDCTISRERSYEADIPEYPVEDGYYVSDSIHKKPLSFELVVFVTNMPVTWAKRHAGSNRVKNTIDSLVELYLSGRLSTLVTPDKVYENMGITKLSVPEEDYVNVGGYNRRIELQLQRKFVGRRRFVRDNRRVEYTEKEKHPFVVARLVIQIGGGSYGVLHTA